LVSLLRRLFRPAQPKRFVAVPRPVAAAPSPAQLSARNLARMKRAAMMLERRSIDGR